MRNLLIACCLIATPVAAAAQTDWTRPTTPFVPMKCFESDGVPPEKTMDCLRERARYEKEVNMEPDKKVYREDNRSTAEIAADVDRASAIRDLQRLRGTLSGRAYLRGY